MNKTQLFKFLIKELNIKISIAKRGMGIWKRKDSEIVLFFGEYSEKLLPWQLDKLKKNNIDILKIYGVK